MKIETLFFLLFMSMFQAQNLAFKPAKVSYSDFKNLVTEIEPYREQRLINFDTFIEMSKQKNVVILDTRSDNRYKRKHLKGVLHLAFTDFTQANLKKIIPNPNTKILIYCNNNFEDDEVDFASKIYIPSKETTESNFSQDQQKPISLALNIPTFINLFGYGYKNILRYSFTYL